MSDSAAPSQPLPPAAGPAAAFQAENAEHVAAPRASASKRPPECWQDEDGEHLLVTKPAPRAARSGAA